MKVLALDYGSARTGVAVSDPTGTVARPLCIGRARRRARTGWRACASSSHEEGAERVVVGLPLTLRGDRGEQADETERFVAELRAAIDVPVETFDERFTTTLAGPGEGEDARAAAHLLSSYLQWSSRRT